MNDDEKVTISGVMVSKKIEKKLCEEAEKNNRSRASQVAFILKNFYGDK
jgi:hypothetical protein